MCEIQPVFKCYEAEGFELTTKDRLSGQAQTILSDAWHAVSRRYFPGLMFWFTRNRFDGS
jgi:hypothetical protein